MVLNPATPLRSLHDILPDLDYVLLMCVNPGRGSQTFIPGSRPSIRDLRRTIAERGLPALVEIDGGVNLGQCRRPGRGRRPGHRRRQRRLQRPRSRRGPRPG